jgi:hypothetical protein
MNAKQSFRYHRRRLVRGCMLAYTGLATWIPQRFPDFMCIGAPRAATTWVHKSLMADPQIYLPKRKEVHFYDEPPKDTGSDDSELRWSDPFFFDVQRASHLRWYWYQYRGAGKCLAGDITPLYSTLSAERIAIIRQHMPALKVIYILRNPVERAWSGLRKSAWYQKGKAFLDDKDPEWILRQVMRPEVLVRGDYPRAIENWESVFPREQVLYLFFDDVRSNPDQCLDQLYEFLEMTRPRQTVAQAATKKVNAAPEKNMPDYVKNALRQHYEKQIEAVAARFNRDLSHWLD